MNNNNLPTDDLKKYGIISEDNSFTKKLTADEVGKFLQGSTLVAENKKDIIFFKLEENNTKLNVSIFERDRNIDDILEQSKSQIQYSEMKDLSKPENGLDIEKKAFVFDEKTNTVQEFNLIKNSSEIIAILQEKNDLAESNKYKLELLKLKDFLQEKIDKFPEVAKEITNNLNIVSKTINTVSGIATTQEQAKKQQQSQVLYDVNDPDLYQDANREREEEQEQEQERKKGFRR